MLTLKNIKKTYKTGDFEQHALKGVSLSFRENEFVAILGPSGSGKTTLLNIVGGLDRYDEGDLIINGKSTSKFKSSEWDSYRNNCIGFIFQSYNLIGHISVLANVEMGMTLSGISKKQRRKRALEVLDKVGLKDHVHKKPNQLSGGQMQRVAIARALATDPDIILADEPTGALDSETSTQIMDLIQEIAKEKLVIMVTHNPDLAEEYATRIVELKDGEVVRDSHPLKSEKESANFKIRKTSMSFLTALKLSFTNILTKKGRTILTAFAGSIGIIGIALILSLSHGMQSYIDKVQEDTLSSYPITIQEKTMDTGELLNAAMGNTQYEKKEDGKIYSQNITSDMLSMMGSGTKTNNLQDFKKYMEENKSKFEPYMNAVQYSYNLDLNIFKQTDEGYKQVNPDQIISTLGMEDMNNLGNMIGGSMTSYNAFTEMLNNKDLMNEQYDILAGTLPNNYDEVVLLVNKDNYISDYALYAIGMLDSNELVQKYEAILKGESVEQLEELQYSYDELLSQKFKVLLNTDYYELVNHTWIDKSKDADYLNQKLSDALEIKVVGIIRPKEETITTQVYGGILYTSDLTNYVIDKINESDIAKAQKENPETNIFTNQKFTKEEFDISKLSPQEQAYLATLSQRELAEVLQNYQENASATYESNLKKLGIVDLEKPSVINMYAKDFNSKEELGNLITEYNEIVDKDDSISYTDMVGIMMSGVSTIIDIISYVLITFVSISLVVSSIMIGIITYISVLERTKEIGILRSIGASKKDISRVFNAETLIIGLTAGLFGIGITLLLNIPVNIIIKNLAGVSNISSLPIIGGIILVLISMFLTIIAGLIPARIASRKDPVEALRTE